MTKTTTDTITKAELLQCLRGARGELADAIALVERRGPLGFGQIEAILERVARAAEYGSVVDFTLGGYGK